MAAFKPFTVKTTNERILPNSGMALVGAILNQSGFRERLNNPAGQQKYQEREGVRTYKSFDGLAPSWHTWGQSGT